MDPKRFLTTAEAAVALGTSETTVFRTIDRGRLTPIRENGRTYVSRAEVEILAAERAAGLTATPVGTPIADGARLIVALAESGTGLPKLHIARAELARIHRDQHRVATSDEIIDVLSHELGEEHGTVVKARSLAARGVVPNAADDTDFAPLEQVLAGTPIPEFAPLTSAGGRKNLTD